MEIVKRTNETWAVSHCWTSATEFVTHHLHRRKKLSIEIIKTLQKHIQDFLHCPTATIEMLVSWQRKWSFKEEHVCIWHCPNPREPRELAAISLTENTYRDQRSCFCPACTGPFLQPLRADPHSPTWQAMARKGWYHCWWALLPSPVQHHGLQLPHVSTTKEMPRHRLGFLLQPPGNINSHMTLGEDSCHLVLLWWYTAFDLPHVQLPAPTASHWSKPFTSI